MPAIFQLRCHHCKQWLGEAPGPMELVGLFKDTYAVEQVTPPRYTWRCKACGWANVFRTAATGLASWREVELKQARSAG